MPQLTVRGISIEYLLAVSKPMVEELAAVCGCGTDNFTIDCLATASVFEGKTTETYPFVEVAWFERGRDVRNRVAETITRFVRQAGVPEVEVAFKVYSEAAYYINGIACDSGEN
ncbi:DUF1904 family protein [Paenibacillus sp.]|uniref:DUF1904 family protein n=1 Tax=Paenibacillus sp. TaxID=58172 RepID=UPI0028120833|nr:DUF1904 family protein [Paenibacillus sp.]